MSSHFKFLLKFLIFILLAPTNVFAFYFCPTGQSLGKLVCVDHAYVLQLNNLPTPWTVGYSSINNTYSCPNNDAISLEFFGADYDSSISPMYKGNVVCRYSTPYGLWPAPGVVLMLLTASYMPVPDETPGAGNEWVIAYGVSGYDGKSCDMGSMGKPEECPLEDK